VEAGAKGLGKVSHLEHLLQVEVDVDPTTASSPALSPAHWCTLVVSVVVRPLMHLRCRRVIALLA
jgi:hypothetical protein